MSVLLFIFIISYQIYTVKYLDLTNLQHKQNLLHF